MFVDEFGPVKDIDHADPIRKAGHARPADQGTGGELGGHESEVSIVSGRDHTRDRNAASALAVAQEEAT